MVRPNITRIVIVGFLLTILATYAVCITHLILQQAQVDSLIFYCTAHNFWQHQSLYSSFCSGHFHHIYTSDAYLLSLSDSVDQLGVNYLKNLNSPVFALLLLPWGLISYDIGAVIWHLCTMLAQGLAIWLLYTELFAKKTIDGYCLLLSLYLVSAPAYMNTLSAEVGGLFFLAVTAVWFWARKSADRKAGILLGVILSMKYFFVALLLLFLLQRRWRLLGCAVLSFLLLNGLALIVFGRESFIQYEQILHHINWFFTPWNGSLYGFLSEKAAVVTAQKIIMAKWATVLYGAVSVALIAYQCFFCRKRFVRQIDFDCAFAYTFIIIVLIGPLSWLYYFPFLMLPLLFFLGILAKQPLTVTHIFVYLLMLFLLIVPIKLGETTLVSAGNIVHHLTYSGFLFGVLLLLVLWFVIGQKRIQPVLLIHEREIMPWLFISFPVAIFSFTSFLHNTF